MKPMFLLCCVVSYLSICAFKKLVIRTADGLIRGKLNCYDNFEYYSYQSIPYAENPSGNMRFQPPIPKKPWKHVLDATQDGVVCPQWQMRYRYEQMSEDCLILNVYVPKCRSQLLPVLVFIHGGGFILLSGGPDYIYGPQLFLQRQIIVVTMNFRLGPLGFLSLGINEASGNAGVKDIILALKWVQTNISKFGGNKKKVTIGGHSSGAAIVHFLLLTNKTNQLFQQAITISGSALNYRFLSLHPIDNAMSLAKELGIKSEDRQIVLEELQETNVFEMMHAFKNLSLKYTNVLQPCGLFVPCVEREFSHAVITENPLVTLAQSGIAQNVPILTGINTKEGIYMLPKLRDNSLENLYNNNELYIPCNIEYPKGSQEAKRLGNLISQMYFYDGKSENVTVARFIDLESDIRYVYGVYDWIKLHKRNPRSNSLYFYNFDFDGDLNWSKLNYKINYSGTSHADELGYIFVTNRTINRIKHARNVSRQMIDVTVDLFSNFIRFGKPKGINNIDWPEFDIEHQKYFIISINSTVKEHYSFSSSTSKNLPFWDYIYNQYRKYVDSGGKRENKCSIN